MNGEDSLKKVHCPTLGQDQSDWERREKRMFDFHFYD